MPEKLVTVPTAVVERHTRRAEQLRKARAAYDARTARTNHHGAGVKLEDRPFVGWDGEGPRDAGYALFGSSAGDEICHPFLGTAECLDLILDREAAEPDSIHVWFGSNYDVSMILKDVGWKRLSALKHWTKTVWGKYEIEHIPGKWFQVKAGGHVAKLFDIHSFFSGSYVKALNDMGVGSAAEIDLLIQEKARRSQFQYSEILEIRDYWRLELRLMPELCNKLRSAFLAAGFKVQSWHGPGALANMAMRKHKINNAMAVSPSPVRAAARCGFAGGRFEMFRGGHVEKTIYNADIHSAYPYFATQLPDLSAGTWRETQGQYEPGKFGIYHIRYKAPPSPLRPFPLFHRLPGGEVIWDNNVEGWYWGPEAALVAESDYAQFTHAYIFDEDDPTWRPFAWLEDYYHQRQRYLKEGSVLELVFKLIINSIYGQLAQRTGWDRKGKRAPRSHQLEWAGWITSACRAAVYRVGDELGDELLSIDTDGIYATRKPSGLVLGDALGQWDISKYDSGIFWQSGIYALREDLGYDPSLNYGWIKGRTRGIPKGRYRAEDLISALSRNEPLELTRNVFTGYGLALNGQRDKLNTWSQEPVKVVFGGEGKRYHNTVRWCGKRGCLDGVHEFIARPVRFNPGDSVESYPHFLPWEESDALAGSRKGIIDDMTMFDLNGLDFDELWVNDYVDATM